jgi:hypothetical protein
MIELATLIICLPVILAVAFAGFIGLLWLLCIPVVALKELKKGVGAWGCLGLFFLGLGLVRVLFYWS